LRAQAQRSSATNRDGSAPRGSGSRARVGVLALVIAALALLALAPSAFASRTLESSFASPVPGALAVDESNGNVYVLDPVNQQVRRYDSSGAPAPFSALSGSNVIDGAGGADATPAGGFAFDLGSQIAVDNSGGPTDGRVYVADTDPNFDGKHATIQIFDRSGTRVGQLTGSGTPLGNWADNFTYPSGVAVDSNGAVYVAHSFGGAVQRFVPSGATVTNADYEDRIAEIFPSAIVVDSSGSVYAANTYFGESSPLSKYSASDFGTSAPTPTVIVSDPIVSAIAVDPSSDEVYAAEGDHVAVFDSAGNPSYTFGSAADFGNARGVAVRETNGKAYVSDAAGEQIDVYSPSSSAAKPAVTPKPATAVGPTGATLNAIVNPNSAAVTDCHFEYVEEASFQTTGFTGAQSAPCVPAPGSGSTPVAVSATVSLVNNTPYRFRAVATNGIGTRTGGTRSFTTLPAVKALVTLPATPFAAFSATLRGSLDPDGTPITDCHFEYTDHADFLANGFTAAQSVGCSPAPGSASGSVAVSAPISDLSANTVYDFRLVATNADGTTFAQVEAFTTADVASTDPADAVHQTSAVLRGHLNPHGDPGITDCYFEWGETTAYGQETDCDQGDSFSAPVNLSAPLGNLDPGKGYHFRLHLTTTSHGDAIGADRSFTTAPRHALHPKVLTIGSPGSGDGQLSLGRTQESAAGSGVALNHSTHDVYVADTGNRRISVFDSDGNFLRTFGWGVDDGTAAAQVCTSGCQAGISGSGSGQFTRPALIAIDNSGGPSDGAVYIGDSTTKLIQKFDASGNLITAWGGSPLPGQLDGNGVPNGPFPTFIVGIAVDASGTLHVLAGGEESSTPPGRLWRFSQGGTYLSDVSLSSVGSGVRAGFGLTPDGSFYARGGSQARISLFKADGGLIGAVATLNAQTFAADPSSGGLYVGQEVFSCCTGPMIASYAQPDPFHSFNPDGTLCLVSPSLSGSDIGCQPFEKFLPGPVQGEEDVRYVPGLAIDPSSKDVYAAVVPASEIQVLSAVPQLFPTLTSAPPTEVTGSSATLNAKVDPETTTVTECHFDWGETTSYGNVAPCSPDPGSGSGDVPVSAAISGLSPGITYHFRIQASSADGTVSAPDQSFTATGPRIKGTVAAPVTDTAATLTAKINPSGEPTTYHFEWGTDVSYGSTTEERSVGSNSDYHPVSDALSNLTPATTYHFRVVATNADATVVGPDASFTTTGTPDSCPNAAVRSGFGHALPDCRAYEQATPVDKKGSNATGNFSLVQASSQGDRVSFVNASILPTTGGTSRAPLYFASRGAGEWSSDGIMPPTTSEEGARELNWSDDLSNSVSFAGANSGGSLILRDSATAVFSPAVSLAGSGSGSVPVDMADGEPHFIFESPEALAPGAIDGGSDATTLRNLYEYEDGSVSLAGRVPPGSAVSCDDEGVPLCVPAPNGSFGGPYNWTKGDLDVGGTAGGSGRLEQFYLDHAMSLDGERFSFTERGSGRLFVREQGARSTWVSAPEAGVGPDPNGTKPAAWLDSTPSGSKVFFSSCEKLTADSTAVSTGANECTNAAQGQDLYVYDVASGDLTDLTVDTDSNPKGAQVVGFLGSSADGADAYFIANGDLDGAGPATPGDCAIAFHPAPGSCNLYHSHAGQPPVFIARLNGGNEDEYGNWQPLYGNVGGSGHRRSHVAADGTLLFLTAQSLTGYDNTEAEAANCGNPSEMGPCNELFRYTPAGELSCTSCNPSGVRPVGDSDISTFRRVADAGSFLSPKSTRNVSADGDRIFFDSADALVPADVNGVTDVYEWEAQGSGSCSSDLQNGGCIYLISTGTDESPSFLGDASADGDDVFFFTAGALVPQDTDQLVDVYDARVGGGLAYQHQVAQVAPPPCDTNAGACEGQGTAAPAIAGAGTAAFSGPGNTSSPRPPRRCAKGKVRRRGRCVSRHKRKKSQKRQKARANANRGGAK